MDIKNWLGQYQKAIRYAEKCFQDLDSLGVIKSPNMDGMPRGEIKGDNVERMAIHQMELRERAEKARNEALRLADEIYDTIDTLEDYGQKMVVVLRYIYGYTWDEVAINTGTSLRTVHRLHGRALEILRRTHENKI